MMTQIKRCLPLSLLLSALMGCASVAPEAITVNEEAPAAMTIDSSMVVTYACGAQGTEPLQAEYGFVGNMAVVALVNYQGQVSPMLQRVTEDSSANVFYGEGVVWMTELADLDTIASTPGRVLLQEANPEPGSEQATYDEITQGCRVVPTN
ncbi:MAG: hypothetical protein KBC57_14505 [Neisseriaceae bacterium]|nr:hypothetical protein [Neisseriaceae bacterium]MBP6863553.1 hypothetical protein [Neisseriaceae bacterium]